MIEKSITWTGLARCAALRVIKVVGADRTWYLFAGGQVVSEFEDAASNNYSSGTMPGQAGSDSVWTQLYQHSDHLTTRVTTENDADVSNQQGHYPYGELWYSTGTADASVLRKFTSYEKDAEVAAGQLHYAVFRTHGARIGRFLRPDPVRGRISNPQRLNRYAYVMGDPTNKIDPRGLDECDAQLAECTQRVATELNTCLERAARAATFCSTFCTAVCLFALINPAAAAACVACTDVCLVTIVGYGTYCLAAAAIKEMGCVADWTICKARQWNLGGGLPLGGGSDPMNFESGALYSYPSTAVFGQETARAMAAYAALHD